jgi:prepilin-type N-terminal cleavage/methylation domain-containing protein
VLAARRAASTGGFTLVEVLVALAVLAITTAFAFRAFSGALVSLNASGREQTALMLAESMMDRVGRDIDLRDGDSSGQTVDGFIWRLQMRPYDGGTGCGQATCDGLPQAIVVSVAIGWTEQRRARQVNLSTLRLTARTGS